MATTSVSSNPDSGDLGLGHGWKPGAIPRDESDEDTPPKCKQSPKTLRFKTVVDKHFISKHVNTSKIRSRNSSLSSDRDSDCEFNATVRATGKLSDKLKKLRIVPSRKHKRQLTRMMQMVNDDPDIKKELMDGKEHHQENGSEPFPVFADVPLGTSMRQQRILFEYNIQELFSTSSDGEEPLPIDDKKDGHSKSHDRLVKINQTLQQKLAQAQQDIDALKQDLEQSHKQLESKYKAIAILQKQADASKTESQKSNREATQSCSKLKQEISQLEFDLEYRQSTLMNSQQLWAERFDRMSQENGALMDTLEARSSEMRKLNADKMALERERDELLALLDIQERERYEALKPKTSQHVPYSDFTSSELAVLGACHCQLDTPDPCRCALSAANLHRDTVQLQEQVTYARKQHQEALVTSDAYRQAFEEQLNRNKNLVRQLAELTADIMSSSSKVIKFKAAMKWLLQQLNEDLPPPIINGDTGEKMTVEMLEEKTEQELILMLVDMVSDKNEALAHQRLAARLLADRAKELEEKLAALTRLDGAEK